MPVEEIYEFIKIYFRRTLLHLMVEIHFKLIMCSYVFHNKTCIRSAMESVIEIAGGAPRGLRRSLLGGDLALGIGSIPLV